MYQNQEKQSQIQPNPSKPIADCVRFTINPLWKHTIPDVTLPIQRIFDYVPIHPSHIKDWLRFGDGAAGLMFPEMLESREPKIGIMKSSVSPHSIQADITVYIFQRELAPSHALQLFDPTIWHPTAYSAWHMLSEHHVTLLQLLLCNRAASDVLKKVLLRTMQNIQCA